MDAAPEPWLLVVAGHDSSGRAGVDADREAAAAQGLRTECAVTAWTVQDAGAVRAVRPRAPAEWLAEARRLAEGRPAALKLGLLPGAAHVEAARRLVVELRGRFGSGWPVVLDPVLAASTGEVFLDDAGRGALLESLEELAPVLTPNLGEAAALTGLPAGEALELRLRAAAVLGARGARAVLLKGGHGREDPVVDLLWRPGAEPLRVEHPRVAGPGIRGSGCRHASALAAALARGLELDEAARLAGASLAARIARELGRGGAGAGAGG